MVCGRGPKICRESHVSRDSRVTHGIFSSFVRDCEGQEKFSCDHETGLISCERDVSGTKFIDLVPCSPGRFIAWYGILHIRQR